MTKGLDGLRELAQAQAQHMSESAAKLNGVAQRRAQLLDELADVEKEYSSTWRESVGAGWTEKALTSAGYDVPTAGAGGRKSSRSRKAPASAPATQKPPAGGSPNEGQ